ncbi:hypothetical protein CAPTEDRAFT_219176 [Capitella teleta]|uniref:Uncharacterized protein n=1 Tax=Capitella teleta TaxID=283909 RepID=R7VH23_CAPTE|nr:hypothetical protein CAPTEDRAFT_219176 [Capitella teleta]|eukprot:ELU14995.1 hypothetical protein CAPTEDRAFT_219176 [Capitella teleta]
MAANWPLLILQVIVYFASTSGLQECLTGRKRCISSRNLNEDFVCEGKGKFEHPNEISSMYILCKNKNHFACECVCPPKKSFSPFYQRCVIDNNSMNKDDNSIIAVNSWTTTSPHDDDIDENEAIRSSDPFANIHRESIPKVFVEDQEAFPAWALALVVLCLVILVVLIILVFY